MQIFYARSDLFILYYVFVQTSKINRVKFSLFCELIQLLVYHICQLIVYFLSSAAIRNDIFCRAVVHGFVAETE